MRSPTMVRWPGTVPAGVSPYRWAFWDVLPTFAELAGLEAPRGLDGVSIVPTLMGRSQTRPAAVPVARQSPGPDETILSNVPQRPPVREYGQ